MATQQKKAKPTGMSKSERAELRRLVRRRFEMLELQVKERRRQIRSAIQERISAAAAEKVKKYEAEAAPLFVQLDAAVAALKDLEARAEADGIQAGTMQEREEYVRNEKGKIVTDGNYGYVTRKVMHAYPEAIVIVHSTRTFVPEDFGDRVDAAFGQIEKEAGFVSMTLEQEKIALEEELITGALESGEAKDFLGKLPTVDKLLPAPNGEITKAIEQVSRTARKPRAKVRRRRR
jgi:hypothetical protein